MSTMNPYTGLARVDAEDLVLPDAELLHLGRLLTEAWAREHAAWAASEGERDDFGPNTVMAQTLSEATAEIVDRIEHQKATTLGGLHVKMRAFQWCRSDEPITVDDVLICDHPATNERLMIGIMADLWTMGEGGR